MEGRVGNQVQLWVQTWRLHRRLEARGVKVEAIGILD